MNLANDRIAFVAQDGKILNAIKRSVQKVSQEEYDAEMGKYYESIDNWVQNLKNFIKEADMKGVKNSLKGIETASKKAVDYKKTHGKKKEDK